MPNPSLNSLVLPVVSAETVSPPDTFTVLVSGGACPVADTVVIADCGIFPVDAIDLSGEAVSDHISLSWISFNESEVDFYEVYHSANGNDFDAIGRRAGIAFGNNSQAYQMDHSAPAEGRNYYRLRAVDFNGHAQMSETIEVLYSLQDGIIAMYPNPASPGSLVSLDYFSREKCMAELTISDMMGRIVTTESIDLIAGLNTLEIPIKHLGNTGYFVRIRSYGGEEVIKLMVID